MFSDAISSISSRWRPSSRRTTSAISGSVSASEAVNRLARSDWAGDGSVIDFTLLSELAPAPGDRRGDSIQGRNRQAMGAGAQLLPTYSGVGWVEPFRETQQPSDGTWRCWVSRIAREGHQGGDARLRGLVL